MELDTFPRAVRKRLTPSRHWPNSLAWRRRAGEVRGNENLTIIRALWERKAVFLYILLLPLPEPSEEVRAQGKDSDWSWQWHGHFLMALLSKGAATLL